MPERKFCEYKNLSKRFYNTSNDYSKQYCAIYNVRLEKMRATLEKCIRKRKDVKIPICKLADLSINTYSKCFIIGTLFKDQKLKPSVLKQLQAENQLVPQPVHKHFTDESDSVYVEDESQRYKLTGNLNVSLLVTGITCALLGTDLGDGKFEVDEMVFADYHSQVPCPIHEEDTFVVFISGMGLLHYERHLLQLQLFMQWIAGVIGTHNDIDVSKITRVIIGGNSIMAQNNMEKRVVSMTTNVVETDESIDAVKTLDNLLLQLCQVIDVDIMPGDTDPSNHVLPQKNLHICMFPKSKAYKSMNSVTNPYECDIGGCRILGTSGQPITDVLRFADFEKPIDALEACLKWGHMAPTAPDTLGCFPYYDNDPFIIEDRPHVFFSSNHPRFETKMMKTPSGQCTRLIAVPEFATTKTACVLNLKDLSCVPITFDC